MSVTGGSPTPLESTAEHRDGHLLTVDSLVVDYPGTGFRSQKFRAVDDVSFHIDARETLGVVGESGSGKSTTGRAILGLSPVTSGAITFDGESIVGMRRSQRRRLSSDVQVVFQDPYGSLNPSMTIESILGEPLIARGASRSSARRRIRELLDNVGLPSNAAGRLPREFSGGQRQRIAIARAIALSPRLIVCDEPVSALDLTTQARILDLLLSIQLETGVAYLFVSHDLEVIRHISHRVAVMRSGKIVEQGEAAQVTSHPNHLYTKQLLAASPVADPDRQAQRRMQRAELLKNSASD